MSIGDSPPTPKAPGRGADAAAREAERRERLAAALRANLRKRKAPGRPARPEAPDGEAG
ncbi:hypothetical protein [Hansschlegelia sp. KR7-227]|uniref:hypothetical protein n=1 Tax=Hansschlegelia sp. KR7-227 TaxID=3400914 RepID=UPI003BFA860D